MIRGITETSFLDWDGKIVTVLYSDECNFKCGFCHNWQLMCEPIKFPEKSWENIEAMLKEHADFLDGVCISGGEPTLEPDLEPLIKNIRGLGLKVKLDTNGSRPEVLKRLLDKKYLDALAMDVKAPLDERYSQVAGCDVDLEKIKESIDLIKESGIEHEFRTTVVPTIHEKKDILDIARLLEGASVFVIQQFVPDNAWHPKLRAIKPYPNEFLLDLASEAKKFVKEVRVRGLR